MNSTSTTLEQTLDVSVLPPRERHPSIFNLWHTLEAGQSFLLVNDHDPVPLYYQFASECEGGFRWEYLERGPDRWRVRLSKGQFAEPGFVPAKPAGRPGGGGPGGHAPSPRVLDTRPLFARGENPCGAIDSAVASLVPGQTLVLLVPFEPVPLYTRLGGQGFLHQSSQLADGTWRVEFRR